VRGDEKIRVKPHRLQDVHTGDIVVKHSSGGGGVGDPRERDRAAVRADVRNGFVSAERAREIYGLDDAQTESDSGGLK
jgi:N-methylhydantoinase B